MLARLVLLASCSFFALRLGYAVGAAQYCASAVATFGHLRIVNSLRLSARALSCLRLALFFVPWLGGAVGVAQILRQHCAFP